MEQASFLSVLLYFCMKFCLMGVGQLCLDSFFFFLINLMELYHMYSKLCACRSHVTTTTIKVQAFAVTAKRSITPLCSHFPCHLSPRQPQVCFLSSYTTLHDCLFLKHLFIGIEFLCGEINYMVGMKEKS